MLSHPAATPGSSLIFLDLNQVLAAIKPDADFLNFRLHTPAGAGKHHAGQVPPLITWPRPVHFYHEHGLALHRWRAPLQRGGQAGVDAREIAQHFDPVSEKARPWPGSRSAGAVY